MNIKEQIEQIDHKIKQHSNTIKVLELDIIKLQSICDHETQVTNGYGIQERIYCKICGKRLQ